MEDAYIQVFLKFPESGRVKTRLAREIGDAAAATVYRALVARVFEHLPAEFPLCVAYAPASVGEDAISRWLRPHLEVAGRACEEVVWIPQVEVADLGQRLGQATGTLFARGAGKVIAVGADCPYLEPEVYREAAGCLDRGRDVVFGPTLDGGYYLVGLAAPQERLFGDSIPWSSARTLEASLEAAASTGLNVAVLDKREDVDDLSAWVRARDALGLQEKNMEKTHERIGWDRTFGFAPVYQQRVWGGRRLETDFGKTLPESSTPYGESWEVCDRDEAMSVVAGAGEGCDGVSLQTLWRDHREEVFGAAGLRVEADRFPILIKILDCREDLSLQVHPSAEQAEQLGGEAKTEMWWVAQADPGARISVGLQPGVTRAGFEHAVTQGRAAECIHVIDPKPGDFIMIPSGRVHAIGGGLVIFEVQQNSDTTYRVFDWNRTGLDGKPRELHLEASMASIDFGDHEPTLGEKSGEVLVDCVYFKVELWDMAPGTGRICLEAGEFCVIGVVEGGVFLGGQQLAPGDFRVMPASAGLQARPIVASSDGAKLLITMLPT